MGLLRRWCAGVPVGRAVLLLVLLAAVVVFGCGIGKFRFLAPDFAGFLKLYTVILLAAHTD